MKDKVTLQFLTRTQTNPQVCDASMRFAGDVAFEVEGQARELLPLRHNVCEFCLVSYGASAVAAEVAPRQFVRYTISDGSPCAFDCCNFFRLLCETFLQFWCSGQGTGACFPCFRELLHSFSSWSRPHPLWCPMQVVRYDAVGDGPLWSSSNSIPNEADVPPCGRCGQTRKFEFQVCAANCNYLCVHD